MSRPRIVIDTTVWVSGLILPLSIPRQCLDRTLVEAIPLFSLETLAELNEVLSRPKFDRYLTLAQRTEFLQAVVLESEIVQSPDEIVACRDPKDDKFLSVAVSGKAQWIVSGDSDLIAMSPFQEILILTPRAWLEGRSA